MAKRKSLPRQASFQRSLCLPQFSTEAQALRSHFDQRFLPAELPSGERFVWDYWHVPQQYSLLRTPAYLYFPKALYMKWHHAMVQWGRKNLGCWDIVPPWLSCYIEGCSQNLHADVPHGPWAFVHSLTRPEALRSGGETLLLRDATLNYWQNFTDAQGREYDSFVERIPPRFNQLLVFDPRIPHGVSEVRGVRDPRAGRLVLHSWFTQPKTYIEGPLAVQHQAPRRVSQKLNEAFQGVCELVANQQVVTGVVSIGIEVTSSGRVASARFLTNSLRDVEGSLPRQLSKRILDLYRELELPPARGKSSITVTASSA